MLRVFSTHSFKARETKARGRPVAQVYRGKKPIKTVYIKDIDFEGDEDDGEDDKAAEEEEEDKDFDEGVAKDTKLPRSFFSSLKNFSMYNRELLRKAIRHNNKEILSTARPATQYEYLSERFQKAQKNVEEKHDKVFAVSDPDREYIKFYLPDPTFRVAIFAPSNAGKSTLANKWIEALEERHGGDIQLYMWGFFTNDPAYAGRKKMQYIKMDDSLIKDPPTMDEFEPCVHVFDDIESLKPAIRDVVQNFRDSVYKAGRKRGQSGLSIAHEIFDGNETKVIHGESEYVVIFPRSAPDPIKRFLQKKCNMSKEQVVEIMSQPTRWVCVKKSLPIGYVTSKKVVVF